jgi:protein-S-isoprenylcysteine O-methyltransferase Ste14
MSHPDPHLEADMTEQGWYATIEQWCSTHRIWATAPVIVLLLVFARPTPLSLWLGAAIVLLGEAGRAWASGYIDKNARLATAGPYRFTRNPLYFANAIIFAGFCTMAANPWAAVLGIVLFTIIYRPVLRHEAQYMETLFGDEFRQWAAAVPLFFPRPTGYPGRGSYVWALVYKHREHKNALAMLAGIMLFMLIGWWRGGL